MKKKLKPSSNPKAKPDAVHPVVELIANVEDLATDKAFNE